jgi:hypothetical protein
MSPIRKPTPLELQSSQPAQETPRMPLPMHRFLDVAVSILIVFLASLTAGATAVLGA